MLSGSHHYGRANYQISYPDFFFIRNGNCDRNGSGNILKGRMQSSRQDQVVDRVALERISNRLNEQAAENKKG